MNNDKDTKPAINSDTAIDADEIKKLWQSSEPPEIPQEKLEFSYRHLATAT